MKKRVFWQTVLIQTIVFAIACFIQPLFFLLAILSIGFLITGLVFSFRAGESDNLEKEKNDGMALGGLLWVVAEVMLIVILIKYGPNC